MLSIAAMSAGQENYYLELAREDYYLAGGEPQGQWQGAGARALGLHGTVERVDLSRVLGGLHPRSGRPLGQHQNYRGARQRQPGWDLTFSAPKSVSVLWALGPREVREAVQAAHSRAATAGLSYLEAAASHSRRGKGGAQNADRAELVIATFEHGTSRAQDPQLHTHALLGNLGLRPDGTWGAIRSKDFYQHKMAAGALYRAELGAALIEALDLRLIRTKTWFEVHGIPKALLEHFSTRRAEIEEALARLGLSGAQASERLAKSTRTIKGHIAREELTHIWRESATATGFSLDRLRFLGHPLRALLTGMQRRRALARATDAAIALISEQSSHFPVRAVVRAVADRLQGTSVSAKDIYSFVHDRVSHHPELVALGNHKDYPHFASRSTLDAERALLADAAKLSMSRGHAVSERTLTDVLKKYPGLSTEQVAALQRIACTDGDMALLSGGAGTGKTHLLAAARDAWVKEGYRVIGAAVAARAARQLQKDSYIESSTIAKLLIDLTKPRPLLSLRGAPLTRKTVLVIDEAGMVGTRMMQKLLAESRKARAKVVLVGDERQLQPIEAGGPFASLIRTIGAARLTENKRQHEPWMRQEVKHFLQGSAQDGLRLLAQHDRLHLADTRPKAMAALIKDWQIGKPIGTSFDKSVLILGAQREDVRELNKLAQAARLKATELKKNSAATAGHYTFHPGDRVVFTRNDRKLQVLNGDFGTVVSIRRLLPLTKPQVRIRLDEPGHRRLWGSGTRFVTVVADSSLALDLGYAITTHKAQGATVDRSYVLLGGSMTDRELTYVQMSRARDETHVYASEADAGEDLAELVAAMSRSRQKDLAHDVARIAEQERSRLSLH